MYQQELILPIDYTVDPKSHPQHYLMHKYWGRKSHNIVAEYINHFTKENETVLDPFMGSGVTIIESLKHKRKGIGVDLNPVTNMIVDNTIRNIDLALFEQEFLKIYNDIEETYQQYYVTECSTCQTECYADNFVWNEMELTRVKYSCPTCGVMREDIKEIDLRTYDHASQKFDSVKEERYFPQDAMLKYVRRNGRTHIHQLFSDRALLILTDIHQQIFSVKDKSIREMLLMCFTSTLPNVSRMIPADEKNVTGKSGWQISKFWVPKVHTEKNVIESFKQRYQKIMNGKSEVNDLPYENAQLHNTSSESLSFIESSSVDYIFTDPPYGESINYFGLSMLWNTWLKKDVDYSGEIIYDTYRDKDYDDYELRMNNVFKELSRVLKMNKYLSLTFHNRDLMVWKSVLNSCRLNGFQLINIVYQPQAVASGTQGINKKNTFKGDFIYNFQKISDEEIKLKPFEGDFIDLIKKSSFNIIKKYNGATPDILYSELIPIIVNSHALFNNDHNKLNIDSILEQEFIYVEETINKKSVYKWEIPNNGSNNDDRVKILKDKALNKVELSEPKANEIKENNHHLNVIDLFAGAGGMSKGFELAGFNIILANEFNPQIAETYQKNHLETKVIVGDIKEVSIDDIKEQIGDSPVHVVTGGPPCQGFSMSGNRIRSTATFIDDPRNYLFKEFYKVVEGFKPKYFVMENVEGLLTMNDGLIFDTIYKAFEEMGYYMDYGVLDAKGYGVPQARKRLIILGCKEKKIYLPEETHGQSNGLEPYVTIKDAISDLNFLESGEGKECMEYRFDPQSEYQLARRKDSLNLYNHVVTNHSKLAIERMKLVKPGQNRDDLPEEHKTKSVHSGAYGRMEWDNCATTITTRFDTPSVGRVIHPELNRTITVREAARIQSFNDDYVFSGNRSSQGLQVGNAVPPLLAKAIGQVIMNNEETKVEKAVRELVNS
jgi:DNA-cytosine methyltransferase